MIFILFDIQYVIKCSKQIDFIDYFRLSFFSFV